MSILWDTQTELEEFVNEIIRHIDAAIYVSRATGKFVLKLIRKDYAEGSLLILDESNIIKVANPSKPAFGELKNALVVNYWEGDAGKDGSVSVQDTAMVQMQGQVLSTTLKYDGFTNKRNATLVAQRDLRSLSSQLLSCTVYTTQVAKDLNVGDVFKFSWAKWNVDELVMRITSLAFGDGKNNQIRIGCTQDIFTTPTVEVIEDPGQGWVDPATDAETAENRLTLEAPYYEVVKILGQATIDSYLESNPDIGYVAAAAARPTTEINASMWTDAGSGYEQVDLVDFCPYGVLTTAVGKIDTAWTIQDTQDLDEIVIGSYFQIDEELCRIDSVDEDTGAITVGRGCLDTVPEEHDAGAKLYFLSNFYGYDPTQYVTAEEVEIKLLPAAFQDQVTLAEATADVVTLNQRAYRPYPPGDFRIEGESYGAGPYEDVLTLTWKHRDRLQQTSGEIFDHTEDSIGPEAGTLYRVRVYISGVLSATYDDINALTYDVTPGAGLVTVEVHSKRDGVYSWQGANHTFVYNANPRVTEDLDPRVTEDGGDLRTTEN